MYTLFMAYCPFVRALDGVYSFFFYKIIFVSFIFGGAEFLLLLKGFL